MNVVILAKTRMRSGACIGGITEDGRSVRLIAPDADFNEQFNLDYCVGEVWHIEGDPPPEIIPPHVENIVVRRKRRIGRVEDLASIIEGYMPPRAGGLEVLYDGLAHGNPGGPLYINAGTGVPAYSTLFWRPDRPLGRDLTSKRIRYRYPTSDGGRTLTFVGFQEPPEEIPAGALVRVSLAHWWRPEDNPGLELRCYVQLSGWIDAGGSSGTTPGCEAVGDEEDFNWDQRSGVRQPDLAPAHSLDKARQMLKQVFGYDDFRPLQADIIGNVLAGRNSLAVMPTGSGKSLCYQLPALLMPGLTVVVSPLISLMEDQVMQLRELGVSAFYLNSTLLYDEYVTITRQIKAGRVKIVYTSPETLLRPETLVMLDNCRVNCLTIDEAHCISEWGHDFRPEYRQIAQVRHRLPDAACLAVTATATERVRRDIKDTLGVGDADEFISSFNRENLFLAVEPRDDGLSQILEFLDAHRNESGIIYCHTRDRVDALAAGLSTKGWDALPYHAGLDNATRRENQLRFTHGDAAIIVATIAFGMGINKSNVRFVLHHNLPKDLESYYQQIGRAGRDGLPADCLLLFSRQDAMTINFLAEQGAPAQRAAAAARLQAMIAFAETSDCRRKPLLAYFGENYMRDGCGQCDNCLAGDRSRVDLTIPAQKFLSCAVRTGQIFGASHLIDILRGSRSKELLRRGHDRLSTYNIGREYTKREWQQLARQFVSHGLLHQDLDHGSLEVTSTGRAVLKGETYLGTPPTAERAIPHVIAKDYDVELFDRLRAVRLEFAQQAQVPAFFIFSDAALREMAIYYPQTRESLGQMQGVGAAKLERYGEAFLSTIVDFCRERGLAERSKAAAAEPRPARVPTDGRPRREQVTEMYLQGRSAEDISQTLGIQWNSVMFYLWQSVLEGTNFDTDSLLAQSKLSDQDRDAVYRAFSKYGITRLQPVYEGLQEHVAYEELHVLRLCYALQNPSMMPTSKLNLHEVQDAIIRCVESLPGLLPRSGVAKLLIGSDSGRVSDYKDHPEYGRYLHLPRHIVMAEVDKLLDQNQLRLDESNHLRR